MAALDLLREQKQNFDLVMTDIHMPEMNGIQLLQAIVPEIDIPVVSKLLSNHSFIVNDSNILFT